VLKISLSHAWLFPVDEIPLMKCSLAKLITLAKLDHGAKLVLEVEKISKLGTFGTKNINKGISYTVFVSKLNDHIVIRSFRYIHKQEAGLFQRQLCHVLQLCQLQG
jgi:hypothetical protein